MENFLGNFSSIEEVHTKHPLGGIQGDYVTVGADTYYWSPFLLEWTKEKPTVTVPANKIKEKNNLGNFANILEVYSRYPDGGKEGDYLFIDGIEYVWNRWERVWQSKGDTTPSGGRTTNTFDGNLAVENDLIVGGILRVRGFSFDNKDTPEGEIKEDATITLKDLNEFPITPEQAINFAKKGKNAYFTLVDNGKAIGTVHIYTDTAYHVLTEVVETRLTLNNDKFTRGHRYNAPQRYWRNYGLRQDYNGIKKHEWTKWAVQLSDSYIMLWERLNEMTEVYNASKNGELRTLEEVITIITNVGSPISYKKCLLVSFLDKTTKKRVVYTCTTAEISSNENDWKRLLTEEEVENAKQKPSVLPYDDVVEDVTVIAGSALEDDSSVEFEPSTDGIVYDRVKCVFAYRKGELFYNNWSTAEYYGEFSAAGRRPALGILFYHRTKGNTQTWNGKKMIQIIGNSKTEIIEDASRITEEEINNIVNE